jgi:hypothetical protein
LIHRCLYWPTLAGIPFLVLALAFGAVGTRKLVASKRVTSPAAAVFSSTAAAPPVVQTPAPISSTPAPTSEKLAVEVIGPPHELTVALAPPPIPVKEEIVPVANQEAPQPGQPTTEVAKKEAPKVCEKPSGMFGTSLFFAASPAEARKQAVAQEKLVFLLHVSGDFDDPGFT